MTRHPTSGNERFSRRSAIGAGAAVAAAAGLGLSLEAAHAAATPAQSTGRTALKGNALNDATPSAGSDSLTVVLVHGAFADASGWTGVIERLQATGVTCIAPPNPLRGVSIDSAYMASHLSQIPGRILLVAHSYGGCVISNAATNLENVVGLVYVAGFAPEEGETLLEVEGNSRDSVLLTSLLPFQYPTPQGTANEFAIDPAKFHDAFAADVAPSITAVMAAEQRPCSDLAFSEVNGPPAWKTRPVWAVVPTGDKAVGTDVLRTMATRAGATILEIEGSHAIMVSQPQAVADLIQTAIEAVS
jgi:pimeloyl-ACP methyl ester carboxylesterase